MDLEQSSVGDNVISEIESSEEYELLTQCIEEDNGDFTVLDPEVFEGEEEIGNTVVFPITGLDGVQVSSLAFGLVDGEIKKATASAQFEAEDVTREYRFVHDDEELFDRDNLISSEVRCDGSVDVMSYSNE